MFGIGGALAASGVALDAVTAQAKARPAKPGAADGDLIMVIRHAEKPDDTDSGVDLDGSSDKHSLIVPGWQRAGALASLFAPSYGAVRPGLATPGAVYASVGGDSNSIRPQETVTPTADKLKLKVDTSFSKGQEAELVHEISGLSGATLVAWQHESIADIVAALGSVTPAPPGDWPGERFDVVWTFTRVAGGWKFAQVPQLLLAGDSADPIS